MQLNSGYKLNHSPMAAQLSGVWLNRPTAALSGDSSHRRCRNRSPSATLSATSPSTSSPIIQIVGGKKLGWYGTESAKLSSTSQEFDWVEFDADVCHWTKPLRPVQWYPGHIAKTEKELKDQLKLMDVVIEVRDARIPMSTSHPQMDLWMGNRKRIIVLNREDMISTADRNAWASYYARQGTKVVFSNGQFGMGALKLSRLARALAGDVNIKRKAKGLLPRPVSFL
ncbi:hypothetical protein ACJIZ3_016739 [Penstemon smallii]|uniref:Uncharacterized protein n=1 Tax=Penstemon smallii TaxID=265156 RepID=A0ABD3STR2_9LAMI